MKRILPNIQQFIFLLLFFVFSGSVYAATYTFTGAVNTDWTNPSNWVGGNIAPTSLGNNDTIIINANASVASIAIKSGATLIVNAPATLTVGSVGTPANEQVVDFQNGSIVTIKSGATLIVNGLLNNSNNSNGVVFDGTVTVNGNVTGGNGSVISGSGTLDATGTIITDNSGSIFGSTDNCSAGPCSFPINCTSFTGSISGNQTICSGATPATLTSSTNASSPTYQWQSSTTSGIGFTDITTNGTNPTYVIPGGLTQTTYYRLKIKSTCTLVTPQVVITVNPLPVAAGAITGTATVCQGQSGVSYSVPAITNATSYTWSYSGTGFTPSGTTASITGSFSSNATSGNLTVTGVNACGNGTASTTYAITVNPLPTASISSNNGPICSGANATFTLTGTSSAVVTYNINGGSNTTVTLTGGMANVTLTAVTSNQT
ncbi:hypothetical protein ACSVH5_13415, partial [Flavobacterium sp. RSSA_27]|uniref:hypothetical protein n=1 Tax=Flavobacterium sp. RSSA_27 TaxID=3447667 RepID=UPI003F32B0CB